MFLFVRLCFALYATCRVLDRAAMDKFLHAAQREALDSGRSVEHADVLTCCDSNRATPAAVHTGVGYVQSFDKEVKTYTKALAHHSWLSRGNCSGRRFVPHPIPLPPTIAQWWRVQWAGHVDLSIS